MHSEEGIGEMIYAVIRKAVLQEDEGFEHFIQSFTTKEEAKGWIANQHSEYFSSEDYYIMEQEPPRTLFMMLEEIKAHITNGSELHIASALKGLEAIMQGLKR